MLRRKSLPDRCFRNCTYFELLSRKVGRQLGKAEANKLGNREIASTSNYKSVKKASSEIKFTHSKGTGRNSEVNFLVSFSVIEDERMNGKHEYNEKTYFIVTSQR